jgi:hypothetical protein
MKPRASNKSRYIYPASRIRPSTGHPTSIPRVLSHQLTLHSGRWKCACGYTLGDGHEALYAPCPKPAYELLQNTSTGTPEQERKNRLFKTICSDESHTGKFFGARLPSSNCERKMCTPRVTKACLLLRTLRVHRHLVVSAGKLLQCNLPLVRPCLAR